MTWKYIIYIWLFLLYGDRVSFNPEIIQAAPYESFSVSLDINASSNIFGISFDLYFDPELVHFFSAEEGEFLSYGGCPVSFMVSEESPGHLIVGLSRLDDSCLSDFGHGDLVIFNFRAGANKGSGQLFLYNKTVCFFTPKGKIVFNNWGKWSPATIEIK